MSRPTRRLGPPWDEMYVRRSGAMPKEFWKSMSEGYKMLCFVDLADYIEGLGMVVAISYTDCTVRVEGDDEWHTIQGTEALYSASERWKERGIGRELTFDEVAELRAAEGPR